MRDEQDGATAEEVAHPREEIVLGARVERRGRLVQDDERSISEEGAGEGDALPLADRDVLAVPEHAAGVGAVETREHFRERGLTRSVLADESDHFAGPDLERHIVEREARWKRRAAVLRGRWRITEGHVVEVDAIERRGAF